MTHLGGLAKNSRMRTAKLSVEWQKWTAVSWPWRYRGAVLCDPLHLNWVGKLTTIKNNSYMLGFSTAFFGSQAQNIMTVTVIFSQFNAALRREFSVEVKEICYVNISRRGLNRNKILLPNR